MGEVVILPSPRERLRECEAVIERGMSSFIEVGDALAEIRDSGLYLDFAATFEAYCRDRWDLTRARAYQKIDAARVSKNLDIEVEWHALALLPISTEPDLLREVWAVITDSGERPTAALVRKVLGTDKEKETPTDKELWDALQTLLRGYDEISDVERVVATIPRERHASTARRARKLGSQLAQLAWALEHSGVHIPTGEELLDVARRELAREDLSYQGPQG